MAHFNAAMGGAAITKEEGTSKSDRNALGERKIGGGGGGGTIFNHGVDPQLRII